MLQSNRWMAKAMLVAGAFALFLAAKPAAGSVSLALAVNPVTHSGTVISIFPNSFFSVGVFLISTTSNTSRPGSTCTRTLAPMAKPAASNQRPCSRRNGIGGSTQYGCCDDGQQSKGGKYLPVGERAPRVGIEGREMRRPSGERRYR